MYQKKKKSLFLNNKKVDILLRPYIITVPMLFLSNIKIKFQIFITFVVII